ncbi:hypothetical protein BC827DRAFT_1196364 [Russula dissimulans]|nr:hypothetical protein BC827DRAFT_1196364 [Russula dissimulans]
MSSHTTDSTTENLLCATNIFVIWSPRFLQLTETIIRLNPAHYFCLEIPLTLIAISAPLEPELAPTNALTITSPKTHQVWLLLTALRNPVPESAFNQEIFKWLLAHFDLPSVERLLSEDVWNNSVWHHRFFVTSQNGDKAGAGDEAVRRELAFSKEKIAVLPNNASAWNCLHGLLDYARTPFTHAALAELYVADTVEEGTDDDVFDLENPLPSKGAELPCVAAIDG